MVKTSPWAGVKEKVLADCRDYGFVYADLQPQRASGADWLETRCPFHEDERPSFAYHRPTGNWKCHAGCGEGDVMAYLMRTLKTDFKGALRYLCEQLGVEVAEAGSQVAATYRYTDENGGPLFEVVRFGGKKFRQRRPDGRGGWSWKLNGVRRVLYRLPELIARPGETVLIVEGEKDADRLHAAGRLATTNPGGAGKWRDEYNAFLRDRDVVILPDNDTPGRDHATQVARALCGVASSIKLVELPGLPEKGDVSDWLAAGHDVAELERLVEATSPRDLSVDAGGGAHYPTILVNDRQQRDVVADAWRALLTRNDPPALFNCAGHLARLADGTGGPSIQALDKVAAYGALIRAANWVQHRGHQVRDSKPPAEVAADLVANPHPELPPLEAVLTTPVFDARWRLLNTPGYHRDARVWLQLAADEGAFDVPVQPTAADLDSARSLLLDDLLVDFPFTADSDRAHAVAAIMLPFARRMFEGPTPIHLIEAPSPGSGKSLLADLITLVALGETAGATTLTRDENETRKKITALLARGRAVISIDNVEGGLSSSQLAAAVTTEVWDDRVLGQSLMVTPPNKALWLISANNPNLSLEIARRCVRIRLNPAQEQPWKRTGFKHDPIQAWTRRSRAALVRAILTIIRSWIAAGAPQGPQTLGSFEGWSHTIGGIVTHLGLPGFLGDADEFYASADSESGEWAAFVTAWRDKYHDGPVRASELLELAQGADLVAFARTGSSDTARRAKFGKALNGLRDRRFGDVEVTILRDGHSKARQYRLRTLGRELFGTEGGGS